MITPAGDGRGSFCILRWKFEVMKKIFILSFLSIFFLEYSYSQAPDWIWAKSPARSPQSYCWGQATDKGGNSYITGMFNDSIQFGNIVLQADSPSWSRYVAKYDSSGNVLWAKKIEDNESGAYVRHGVCLDKFNNCFIVGEYKDTLRVDTAI